MALPALLLGDPGRTPFVGHLRARVDAGGCWLVIAGRLAAGAGIEGAYGPARNLEMALRAVTGSERHELLWMAWEALEAMPAEALGPDGGADLSLLLAAGDATGVSLAGVGLAAVWGRSADRWSPLVEGRHPLLAPPGRPARKPGALDLDARPSLVLGCPSHLDPVPPAPETLAARCGWRP